MYHETGCRQNLRQVDEKSPFFLVLSALHSQKLRQAFFGSVLRDDFGPDSDVDLLVEFAAGHTRGWDIRDIEEHRSALLGARKVGIVNRKYLNPRLSHPVLSEAEMIYAEG